MTKKKIQSIDLELHEYAVVPFEIYSKAEMQCALEELSDECIETLQEMMPCDVVKINKNKFKVFSGFELISEVEKRGIENIYLIIHKEISDEKIQKMANVSIVKTLVFSIHYKYGLAKYHELLNECLDGCVTKWLFRCTRLSIVNFAKLTKVTERIIRHQYEKVKEDKQESKSIFARIINNEK